SDHLPFKLSARAERNASSSPARIKKPRYSDPTERSPIEEMTRGPGRPATLRRKEYSGARPVSSPPRPRPTKRRGRKPSPNPRHQGLSHSWLRKTLGSSASASSSSHARRRRPSMVERDHSSIRLGMALSLSRQVRGSLSKRGRRLTGATALPPNLEEEVEPGDEGGNVLEKASAQREGIVSTENQPRLGGHGTAVARLFDEPPGRLVEVDEPPVGVREVEHRLPQHGFELAAGRIDLLAGGARGQSREHRVRARMRS